MYCFICLAVYVFVLSHVGLFSISFHSCFVRVLVCCSIVAFPVVYLFVSFVICYLVSVCSIRPGVSSFFRYIYMSLLCCIICVLMSAFQYLFVWVVCFVSSFS